MANPATVRVYCDEDTQLTADEFGTELEGEVRAIDGVLSVELKRVFDETPFEAILEVEFDEAVTSSDSIVYDISTLSFVHNAQ